MPAFVVAFAYQETLVEWLTRPLPDDKQLVTLGVVEPFTTAVKVSLAAAIAVDAADPALPAVVVPGAGGRGAHAEDRGVFAAFATLLFAGGMAFAYFVVLPRALDFLTNFNDDLFNIQIRASYYFSFVTLTLLASGLAFEMPIFILALVRLRVLSAAKLRRNRRIGYRSDARVRDPAADRRPGLARASRCCRSSCSSRSRSGSRRSWSGAGTLDDEPSRRAAAVRVISADWVLPGRGRADRERRRRDRGRAHRRGRHRPTSSGEGEHFAEAAIVPGFVNAHTHLEYAVYAGFGDGLSFGAVDRDARRAQARGSSGRHGGDRAARRRGVPALGDHDRRRSRLLRRERARLRRARAARDRLSGGLRPRPPPRRCAQFEEKREYVEPALSERVQLGVSPHAPYTCSTEVYAASLELGLPVATHLNESARRARLARCAARGRGSRSPRCSSSPTGRAASAASPRPGCSTSAMVAAHCVKVDDEEIGLLARHGVAVAHCPRSNALLGCGIAPLASAPGGRAARRRRHRRRLVGAVARLLRGAADA